jgi:hypothetical protein
LGSKTAVYDAIDVSVREEEFAGLKTFWQFDLNRCFDGAWAGKSDQGFGFSEDQVAEASETCGYSTHGWVGQDADEQTSIGVVASECSGDFCHLHERQDAFMHSSTSAGAADDDQRELVFGCAFD